MKKVLFVCMATLLAVAGARAQVSVCSKPSNLTGSLQTDGWGTVSLLWDRPADPSSYAAGYVNTASSGLSYGSLNYTAVIRLTSAELAQYHGKYLRAVQFYPYGYADFSVQIWKGGSFNAADTTFSPGTLVYDKPITVPLNYITLNTVELDTTFTVDSTQEMWIGIHAVYPSGNYPIAFQEGAAVQFKGNITYFPLTNSWALLYATNSDGTANYNRNWTILGVFSDSPDIVTGYDLYRNNTLLSSLPADQRNYIDSIVPGTYQYGVRAKYNTGCVSQPVTTNVTLKDVNCTLTVPYSTSFEEAVSTTATTGTNNLPDCWQYWNKGGNSYTNHPAVFSASGYAASGTKYVQFYTRRYVNYAVQYAILPPVDNETTFVNQLKLAFEARAYDNDNKGRLEVGVMSDYTDASTFELVDTIPVTETTYQLYQTDFSSYTGNGRYIAIRCPRPTVNEATWRLLVDNVSVVHASACNAPTALNDTNVTATSLELSWTDDCDGSATYYIECSDGQTLTSTTNSVVITGLTPSTTYTITVYSVSAAGTASSVSQPLVVTTACGPMNSLPFSDNLDAHQGSTTGTTNNLPDCWSYTNTGTYASYLGYPIIYNSSSYANTGTNSLRFYTNSSTYGLQTAILPEIDTQLYPMSTLSLQFNARKYSASYPGTLEVGVIQPDSTFQLVATVSPADVAYEPFTVSFSSYTGAGNRIAIRLPQPASSYAGANVDDIRVIPQNSCATPANIEIHNITATTAQLRWDGVTGASNYEVALVPDGSVLANVVPEQVNDTVFQLTNLAVATGYTLYVRTACSSTETSFWSDGIVFTTKCETVSAPFHENFDTYVALSTTSAATPGAMPDCWTRVNTNTSPYPYVYSTYHYNGTGALNLYSTSSTHSAAVSPAIDMSQFGAGELEISFKLMKSAAVGGRLDVGIIDHFDSDADLDNMTVLRSIFPHEIGDTYEWVNIRVALPNAYAQPQYIVFNVLSGSSACNTYVDAFSVDVVSPCDAPEGVTVSAIAATSAKVNWHPVDGAESYVVSYGQVGGTEVTVSVEASENSFLLGGLVPDALYEVSVSSQCGSANGEAVTSFRTLCLGTGEIAVGSGTTTNTYVPAYVAYQNSLTQQIYTTTDMNNAPMEISSIAFEYGGTAPLSHDIRIYLGHTYYNTMTEAGGWIPMTGAQSVFTGTITWEPGWNYIVLDTPFQYNGLENLVVTVDNNTIGGNGTTTTGKSFKAHSTGSNAMARYAFNSGVSSNGPIASDMNPYNMTLAGTTLTNRTNIRFGSCDATVTCAAPNLFASEDGTSIVLNWAPGNSETSWTVEHKISDVSSWTNDGTVTATTFTLENLLPNTVYDVRVGVDCGGNTMWATASVQTRCDAVQLPLTENFDNATGTTTSDFIPCWYRGTNNTSAINYAYSTYYTSEPYSMRVYGSTSYYSYIASPRLADDVQMDSILIKFNMYAANASYPLQVGIMSDPNDYTTFVPLKTVYQPTSSLSAWALQEVNTKGYTGNGRYIALFGPQWRTETVYVDDIVVDYLVPCAHVTDFHLDDNQSTQVQISWTPGGSETEWMYVLAEGDSVNWDEAMPVSVTENMALLTGLTPSTSYTLYVKSVCDAESESEYFPFPFTTECPPITVPYLESFDNYGTGTNAYPGCWNRLSTTTTKPYVNTTNHTAPAGLYMASASSGLYNMAIFPRLADEVDVSNLQLRMYYRASSSTATNLYVGVMTNPTDYSTFVPVDTLESLSTSVFNEYVVNFDQYQGSGKYIALLNNTAGARYIDDIVLDIIPACENTSLLQVGDISSSSINLTWTAGAEATSYQVMALPAGTPYTQGTPVTLSDTSYTFTGLTENTPYDLFLSWTCAGGSSNTIALTNVRTGCAGGLTLPFIENFDSYTTGTGTSPDCWRLYGTTTTKPYLNTTSNSAPASLFFPSASAGLYNIAVMPRLADGVNLNTLQLRCQLRATTTSGLLYVGVMTNPLDYNTFVIVDSIENASTSFMEQTAEFSSYTGTGRYIALMNNLNAARYVDDISIDIIPACENESSISVSDISASTAEISWTAGASAVSYHVSVVPEGSTFADAISSTISDTTLTLTDLSAATNYTVYLRYVCGDGYSNYITKAFTTQCEAISELPLVENFDNIPGTTASTNNNLPDCWSYYNTGTSYVGYPIVYSGSTYSASGNNSLRFYVYSTTAYSEQIAILPAIDHNLYPLNELKLSFDMRKYSTSYATAEVVVGVIPNVYDITSFVAVDTLTVTETTYEPQVVFFTDYAGPNGRIAIMADILPTYNQPLIDNLELAEASSCKPVAELTVTDLQSGSATVAWTPRGSENVWDVVYQEMYGTEWTEETSGTPEITLNGLTPNTTYTIGVSANCGDEISDTVWMTFTTECLPTPIPWIENFDGITGATSTTTNVLPACWTYLNNGSSGTYSSFPLVYEGSSYAYSGVNAVRFYNGSAASTTDREFLILPEVDTTENLISTLMVTFNARSYSTSYNFNLVVGVMTDPNDASSFTTVDSMTITATTYNPYSVYFTDYAGYGNRIAFMVPNNNGTQWGYVDDINLKIAPTCMPVSDLTISDVTASSMTVSWTPGSTETSWILRYRSEDETQFTTVNVTDTFYVLSNLPSNTSYAFTVQANCGEVISVNSEFVSARTLCLPLDLPFFENFDGVAGTTVTTTNNLPDCWDYHNNNGSGYAGYPVVYNSSTYSNSGNNSLRFYTYTSTLYSDEYAILPEFSTPLNTLKMRFAARCYSSTSSYSATFVVGVVNGMDIASFQPVDTIVTTSLTYENFTVFFDQYTGTTGRIAIKAPQNIATTYNYGNIDDISVTVNNCLPPTQVAAMAPTATTADLTWTAGGDETAWTMVYKTAAADTWSDEISVTGTPAHTLTGLSNGTTYKVRLRSECGADDFSQWVETTFTQNWQDTTQTVCETPTGLTASNIQNESITVTWNADANVDSWNVRYRLVNGSWSSATANTNSYTITGLTGDKDYEIQVQANCGDGDLSDWSGSISAHTTNVGIENWLENSVELFPNPANEVVNVQCTLYYVQSVELFDVFGKLITTTNDIDNPTRINVSGLADGMYFVRVTTDRGVVTKPFVKK